MLKISSNINSIGTINKLKNSKLSMYYYITNFNSSNMIIINI